MSVILRWNIEKNMDFLPHENRNEYYIIGSPGKIPLSFKVELNASDAEIDKNMSETVLKIKALFWEALTKELYPHLLKKM